MSQQPNYYSGLAGKRSSLDSYFHPISINLNGEPTYKTSLGGFSTLVSRLMITTYFIYEMLGVLTHESSI